MTNVRERYFEYLYHIIQMPEDYMRLIGALYDTPFRYSVEDDENRIADAKQLRAQFLDDMIAIATSDDILYMDTYFQITMLEVLIALAKRCVDIADTAAPFNGTGWFWKLVENLGLKDCTNENWDRKTVQTIVRGFLARDISAFPVETNWYRRYRDEEWNEMPLWYQMQFYIQEKYPMK